MTPICPVCQSEGKHANAELYACSKCDNVFQWPLEVTAQYDAAYVHSRYDAYPTTGIMSYLRLGLVKSFVPNGTLLDVGYGNGAFLKAAKTHFDCWGSDVHGVDYGVRDMPLDVAAQRDWSCVTFFDSLEHFGDLALVKKLAQRTDTIIVSVPWRPNDFPKNLKWKHHRTGEHLFYPSLRTLHFLFNKGVALVSDVEDSIRGKCGTEQNIKTVVMQ